MNNSISFTTTEFAVYLLLYTLAVALLSVIVTIVLMRRRRAGEEADMKGVGEVLSRWISSGKYLIAEYDKDRLSEDTGLTPSQLQVYFRYLGKDFRTWRNELRIAKAKEILMSNTELPACDVAKMVGIPNTSNFHKQFLKIVGCTVSQWKKDNANL